LWFEASIGKKKKKTHQIPSQPMAGRSGPTPVIPPTQGGTNRITVQAVPDIKQDPISKITNGKLLEESSSDRVLPSRPEALRSTLTTLPKKFYFSMFEC
jgi:hypothetical protein